MTNNTLIGGELAKSVFEIIVSQNPGNVPERHRLARSQFVAFFVRWPPATVVMEAWVPRTTGGVSSTGWGTWASPKFRPPAL